MIEEACRNTGMPPFCICISGKEKYCKKTNSHQFFFSYKDSVSMMFGLVKVKLNEGIISRF